MIRPKLNRLKSKSQREIENSVNRPYFDRWNIGMLGLKEVTDLNSVLLHNICKYKTKDIKVFTSPDWVSMPYHCDLWLGRLIICYTMHSCLWKVYFSRVLFKPFCHNSTMKTPVGNFNWRFGLSEALWHSETKTDLRSEKKLSKIINLYKLPTSEKP